MDMDSIKRIVVEIIEKKRGVAELNAEGQQQIQIVLRDGRRLNIPLGAENAALVFGEDNGFLTFKIEGKPITQPISLDDIVTILEV